MDFSQSKLPKLFQMMSLNSFGLGLISVFIPIFLLKLGYSLQLVMVWILMQHATLLLASFVVVYFSNRIGLVHCLHIRFLILVSYLLLIFILPNHHFLFFIIPILIGMEAAFFWVPINTLLVRSTEEKSMGDSYSKFFTYPKFFTMWCPLIGALIVSFFSFNTLFIIALIFIFFAFIPLLPLSSEKTNFTFSKEKFKEIWHENKKYFFPEIIDNFTEDAAVLFSIFIFLKLQSIAQVGIIETIAAFFSIFFTLTVGKLTDKWDKHKLFKAGAILVSLSWTFNFFVSQFLSDRVLFYLATIILALAIRTFIIPYQSMLFNSARKGDAQFLVLREVPVVIGRLVLYSLAILLYNQVPILFLVVALSFAYFWFLDSRKFVTIN
jgi:MFS family permease